MKVGSRKRYYSSDMPAYMSGLPRELIHRRSVLYVQISTRDIRGLNISSVPHSKVGERPLFEHELGVLLLAVKVLGV